MFTGSVIWQNRLVKMLDEKTWAMSRIGHILDFDFFAHNSFDKTYAVAGTFNDSFASRAVTILNILKIDDNRLLFCAADGSLWIVQGNLSDLGVSYKLGPAPTVNPPCATNATIGPALISAVGSKQEPASPTD